MTTENIDNALKKIKHLEMVIGVICDTGFVIREGDDEIIRNTINDIKIELEEAKTTLSLFEKEV